MLNRNFIFALAAIATFAVTALAPGDAAAARYQAPHPPQFPPSYGTQRTLRHMVLSSQRSPRLLLSRQVLSLATMSV